jgi:L-ascorbate peroxidase
VWDVSYYSETLTFATTGQVKPGVFVFPSDQKLSQFSDVGKAFSGFVGNQGKWTSSFQNA